MGNYIKSETYRILHYKWSYLFIVICSALLISSNIVLAVVKGTDARFPYATTQFAFSMFYSSMTTVYILCVTVASLAFGNEYTNHTLKNSISYGISRGNIYFGKLLIQVAYAFVAFTIITGVYILSSYLLLENSGPEELELLLKACFICLPSFIFGLALTNCFLFMIESIGGSIAAIVGVMLGLPLVSGLLGMRFTFFAKLSNVLPWNMLTTFVVDLKSHTLLLKGDMTVGAYWIIGMIQVAIFVIIGYLTFRKKEVK